MSSGPYRVGPTKPVVVVLTPSMDLARNETSSMNTPGARYSGMGKLLVCGVGVVHRCHHAKNRNDASAATVPMVRAVTGTR